MEMDVNLAKISAIELVNVAASASPATLNVYPQQQQSFHQQQQQHNQQHHLQLHHLHNNHQHLQHSPHHQPHHHHHYHQHNNNGSTERSLRNLIPLTCASSPQSTPPAAPSGCCGLLARLLRCSARNAGRTASSSIGDYNSFGALNGANGAVGHIGGCGFNTHHGGNNGGLGGVVGLGGINGGGISSISAHCASSSSSTRKSHHRRTPQEVYFESRGKSCKKLLKFNGSSNKILLYPEEGWARTASSSYWTITPCWWQPNRCRIDEFMGATQRHSCKARMVPLEQKGSLLIVGNFGRGKSKSNPKTNGGSHSNGGVNITSSQLHDGGEFKLYLSSNISMEDYNMGYCLTGFVERRCLQSNTFQMTHFAVIKRQWPSISSDTKST